MAEFEDPRPGSPGDSGSFDDVYGLEGEEPLDPDGDVADPELEDGTGLLDDADEASGLDDAEPGRPGFSAPAAAPLPRIWKVAPESQDERPARRAPREGKPASPETPPPPQARSGRSLPPARPEKAPPQARPAKPAKPEKPRKSRREEPDDEPEPVRPSSRGHRREGGEIERIGRVRKLSEVEEASKRKKPEKKDDDAPRRGRRARDDDSDSGKKPLVEETPTFDTQEARQAARLIVGGIAGVVCLVVAFVLVRQLFPGSSEEDLSAPEPVVAVAAQHGPPQASREQLEQEARGLFERARDAAKRDDAKLAVALLTRVVSTYPNTRAAAEAKEALARPERNLPLFVQSPVVVASEVKSEPPKAKPPEPKAVVDATAPAAPKPGTAEVGLVFPTNPAEPAKGAPMPAAEEPPAPIGRPLPKGFRARPGTGVHESGWALEITGDRDGALMVLVPGGEFIMGSDEGDLNERPAHLVFVSTFYIDQHEVTVRQFDLFQKEIGRRTDRVLALEKEGMEAPTTEDLPVIMVSVKESKDYATWAGKRLPTEAQWEKAARGTEGQPYPWGNLPPQGKTKRDPKLIEPIKSHATDVSPYGAYDMAGNAWEWTKDWYDSRYYFLLQKQNVRDPTGPSIMPRAHQLAVRGGSKTWTVTKREGFKWDTHLPFVGFRCVLQVEGPDNAFEPPPKPAPPAAGPAPGMPGAVVPPPF